MKEDLWFDSEGMHAIVGEDKVPAPNTMQVITLSPIWKPLHSIAPRNGTSIFPCSLGPPKGEQDLPKNDVQVEVIGHDISQSRKCHPT